MLMSEAEKSGNPTTTKSTNLALAQQLPRPVVHGTGPLENPIIRIAKHTDPPDPGKMSEADKYDVLEKIGENSSA